MVEPRESLEDLLRLAAQGDEAAQARFVRMYGPHILRIVRHQLPQRLRTKFDSSDFVQDVWASFFAHAPGAEVWDSPERLAAYLAGMARNKMSEIYRQRIRGTRYSAVREELFHDDVEAKDHLAHDPTASQIVVAQEEWNQWQRWLQDLPPHYARILELRRDGWNNTEIADHLGISVRTVCRVVEQLQAYYEASRDVPQS